MAEASVWMERAKKLEQQLAEARAQRDEGAMHIMALVEDNERLERQLAEAQAQVAQVATALDDGAMSLAR